MHRYATIAASRRRRTRERPRALPIREADACGAAPAGARRLTPFQCAPTTMPGSAACVSAGASARCPASDRSRRPSMGFQSEPKWGSRPMATDRATDDCAGMSRIWSVRADTAVEPKHSIAGSVERPADVTDAADPATRERDEVEDCGVASFSGQRSAGLVERAVTSGAREGRRAWLPQSIGSAVDVGCPASRSSLWGTTASCAADHNPEPRGRERSVGRRPGDARLYPWSEVRRNRTIGHHERHDTITAAQSRHPRPRRR